MNEDERVKIELLPLVVKDQISGYRLYINKYYVVYYAIENGNAILDRSKYYLIEKFIRALDPTFEKEISYEEEGYEFNHEDPEDVQLLYNYLHKALVKHYLNERIEVDDIKDLTIIEKFGLSFIVGSIGGTIGWGAYLILMEVVNLIRKVTGQELFYYSPIKMLLLITLVIWVVFFVIFIVFDTNEVPDDDINEMKNTQKISKDEQRLLIHDGYKFRKLNEEYKELYELNFYKVIAKQIQEQVFQASKEGKKHWEATSEIHKDFLSKFPHILWYSGEVIDGKSVEGKILGNMIIW